VEKQRILFFGTELEKDDAPLEESKVKHRSILTLVEKTGFVIYVDRINKKELKLEVNPNEAISAIRDRIFARDPVPETRQVLYYGDIVLHNGKKLSDYKVPNEGRLRLGLIQVIIQLLNGDRHKFEIRNRDTVISLKNRLYEKVPTLRNDNIRLVFRRRELHDKRHLSYYDLRHLSVIHQIRIEIFVQAFDRKLHRFEIDPSLPTSFQIVRESIQQKIGLAPGTFRVLFNGRLLSSNEPLSRFGVRHRSILVLARVITEPFHVIVRLFNGKSLRVNVKPNDPINVIREDVQLQGGIPLKNQRLLFNGIKLDSKRRVSDYPIVNGSVLTLLIRTKAPFDIEVIFETDDEPLKVRTGPSEPIRNIKAFVQRTRNIPVETFSLFHNKQLLNPFKSLDHYRIPAGSKLLVKLRDPFTIRVRVPNGNVHTLRAHPNQPIHNIKFRIQDIARIPVTRQRLFYNNVLLDNRHTLRHYQVPNNGLLVLVLLRPYAIRISFRGKLFNVPANPRQPIRNIIEFISQTRGIPAARQILRFKNNELDSTKSLTHYQVPNLGVIVLEVRTESYFIKIILPSKEVLRFEVNPRQPILSILNRIRTIRDIPISRQKLTHEEKPLDRHRSLTSYQIKSESELVLEVSEPYHVKVILPTDEVLVIQTNPDQTLRHIKQRVRELRNIPVYRQKLLFNNKPLENDQSTLKESEVAHDSSLRLIFAAVNEINVRVKFPSGTILPFKVNPNSRVRRVQVFVRETEKIPINNQILTHNDEELSPNKRLNEHQIPNNALIVVRVRKTDFVVRVRIPNGTVYRIIADQRRPIRDIQERIRDITKIHIVSQRLYFQNQLLNPISILGKTNIVNNSLLNLIVFVRPPIRPTTPETATFEPTNRFFVFVRHHNGAIIRIDTKPSESVSNIQRIIEERLHVPVQDQRLFFSSTHLQPDRILSNYGIKHRSNLVLAILRNRLHEVPIRMPDGRTFVIRTDPSTRIRQLLDRIQQRENIPVYRLVLVFNGLQLDPRKTLEDHRHESGREVLVIVREPFRVNVRLPNGVLHTYGVNPTRPIYVLKRLIDDREHIDVEEQLLTFNGLRLNPIRTLNNYRVPNGGTIVLRRREPFFVNVRLSNGQMFNNLRVNNFKPIRLVKVALSEQTNLAVSQLTLIHNGRVLHPRQSLADYNIPNGTTFVLNVTEQGPIFVFVRLPNGENPRFEVNPSRPIRNLLKQIEDSKQIPIDRQQLYHHERLLRPSRNLDSYNVPRNAQLRLIMRSEQNIHVFVVLPSGRIHKFFVNPQDHLQDLKLRVQQRENIPVSQQNLYLGRVLLHDEQKTLRQLNVRHRSVLRLLLRVIGPIRVHVITPDNRVVTLHVLSSSPISQIKNRVQEVLNIPTRQQRLYYNGQNLHPRKTVSFYNIRRESGIRLVIRPTGPFNVNVRQLSSGVVSVIQINPSETIVNLKLRVQDRTQIAPNDQILLFKNRRLNVGRTTTYYGIQPGSVIDLVRRNRQQFNVIVIGPTGRQVQINIEPTQSLNILKKRIHPLFGIAPNQQRLHFNNRILSRSHILTHYNIINGSVLRLFVRPAAPVRIYVVAPNGRVSRYTVDLSSTVGALKERITQRLFIPTQSQILFYGVSRLSRDSSTLFSYHLRNYAVVRLVQITSTFIPIFVQPARGERVSFDVNPTIQTVYQLKTLVQQRLSISPARQRLIFRGKELRNPFLLVRYNVNRGDTLHLVTVDEKKTTDRFDRFFEPYQCKCNNILHLFLID
jgi:hypothetical protein